MKEIEHLGENWGSGFGEIPSKTMLIKITLETTVKERNINQQGERIICPSKVI